MDHENKTNLLIHISLNSMNRFTLKFVSPQVEKEYIEGQIYEIATHHNRVSLILSLAFVVIGVTLQMLSNQVTQALLSYGFAILTLFQAIYFHLKPNITCLTVLNIYNLLFSVLKLIEEVYIEKLDSGSEDHRYYYIQGLLLMTIHVILINNQTFLETMMIIILIATINTVSISLKNDQYVLSMIPVYIAMSIFLFKEYNRIQKFRELYQINRKSNRWRQILKHTHKDPYVITNFDSLTLQFQFVDGKPWENYNIFDDQTLRKMIRDLRVGRKSLEEWMFRKTHFLRQKDVVYQDVEAQLVLKNKTSMTQKPYYVKMFLLDPLMNQFLITMEPIKEKVLSLNKTEKEFNSFILLNVLISQQRSLIKGFNDLITDFQSSNDLLLQEKLVNSIMNNQRRMARMLLEGVNKRILFMNSPLKEKPRYINISSYLKQLEQKVGRLFVKLPSKTQRIFTYKTILVNILYNTMIICWKQNRKEKVVHVKYSSIKGANDIKILQLSFRIKKSDEIDCKKGLLARYSSIRYDRRCQNIDDLRLLALLKGMSLIGPTYDLDMQQSQSKFKTNMIRVLLDKPLNLQKRQGS